MAAQAVSAKEAKQIDALIAQLVSTSKAPVFNEDEQSKPPNYDRAARKRVLAARDALFAKGVAALPQLIKNIDDRRYSYTDHVDSAVWWKNRDVGGVCYELIATEVEVFRPFVCISPATFSLRWLPEDQKELNAWWKAHQHMSLHDIQLEGAKFALDKTRRWTKADDRTRDEIVVEMIADMEKLVERLQASDKPIQSELMMPLKD